LLAGSLLVTAPVSTPQGRAVLIVGASLDQRAESLSSLVDTLAIVGPLALIIVTLAAYRLTAATLKPVEAMRQKAAVVSATEPGVRLPLPAADDEIRHLGDTLNEMLGRLEDSFARERTFVANASHELRTPLTTMRGFAELGDERAIPLVLSWTEYGKPPFAREAAIRALGKLGRANAKVRERLIDLLYDKNFYARLSAVSALQELHEPEAIDVLNRLASQDVDGRLKSAAAKAVRSIADYLEKPAEFKALRGEIESLRESNKSLLDRLDRLEAKTNSKKR